jgi:hypothetical protein
MRAGAARRPYPDGLVSEISTSSGSGLRPPRSPHRPIGSSFSLLTCCDLQAFRELRRAGVAPEPSPATKGSLLVRLHASAFEQKLPARGQLAREPVGERALEQRVLRHLWRSATTWASGREPTASGRSSTCLCSSAATGPPATQPATARGASGCRSTRSPSTSTTAGATRLHEPGAAVVRGHVVQAAGARADSRRVDRSRPTARRAGWASEANSDAQPVSALAPYPSAELAALCGRRARSPRIEGFLLFAC